MQCVENQNTLNRKRKRKSGKKQSFAGLCSTAVLQARLSSTKVEKTISQANDISKNHEPISSKKLSRLVKNNPLLPCKAEIPDKTNVSITVTKNELSLGIHEGYLKKQKLKDDITVTIKKSKKKKKKIFLI